MNISANVKEAVFVLLHGTVNYILYNESETTRVFRLIPLFLIIMNLFLLYNREITCPFRLLFLDIPSFSYDLEGYWSSKSEGPLNSIPHALNIKEFSRIKERERG